MRSFFCLVFLTAAAPLLSAQPGSPDLFAIDRLLASPSGDAVALATADPSAGTSLTVSVSSPGPKRVFSIGPAELDALLPESGIVDLCWAPDGRYLAVELSAPDLTTAIALLDLRGKGELVLLVVDGHDNLALPRWAPKGHEIWVVHGELTDSHGEADVGGVFRWNIDTSESARVLDELWITDFQVSASSVTALVSEDHTDGSVLARLVRYDLRSGQSETLFRQRSETADGRRKGLVL